MFSIFNRCFFILLVTHPVKFRCIGNQRYFVNLFLRREFSTVGPKIRSAVLYKSLVYFMHSVFTEADNCCTFKMLLKYTIVYKIISDSNWQIVACLFYTSYEYWRKSDRFPRAEFGVV